MGCLQSTPKADEDASAGIKQGPVVSSVKRPKWKSDHPLTREQLTTKREEFWDTQPHYGGAREIWDALKGAAMEPDFGTSKLILESAGVIVASPDLTVCYDEKGFRYELPKFLWSEPSNLVPSTPT